jgi:hypothetical protein
LPTLCRLAKRRITLNRTPLTQQFEISPGPDFERLGEPDGGLPCLRTLLAAYDNWLEELVAAKPYERGLDPVSDAEDLGSEKQQFETTDIPAWRAERQTIGRGIAILEMAIAASRSGKPADDPQVIPLTAWRFMNQTFKEFWTHKNPQVVRWRLFQIAFILAQIPAIVSRLDFWKDNEFAYHPSVSQATLLYFSTGGLSQVLAAAHRVRWAWRSRGVELKGQNFEIGFWVGGNNTPNNPSARGVTEIPRLSDGWDELSARRGDYAVYLKKWPPGRNGTRDDAG